jgi:pyrroline-5-carboxylate reductase
MNGERKVGIIGLGNMGSSILSGIIENKILKEKDIFVFDIDEKKLKNLRVNKGKDNKDVVKNSDIIIIAVKPKDSQNVLEEIKGFLTSEKVLVSIMAGIKIEKIENIVGKDRPVIRMMPNLNVKVKNGIIAYCSNRNAKKYDEFVKKIFSPIGFIFKISEDKFDTITAISGSGPGFLFYIAEEFKKICIEKGIKEEIADEIVKYLFYGTGKMIFETEQEPEKLKEMVCSPGGTTIAGLSVFEEKKFGNILREVINRAEKRSKELSN